MKVSSGRTMNLRLVEPAAAVIRRKSSNNSRVLKAVSVTSAAAAASCAALFSFGGSSSSSSSSSCRAGIADDVATIEASRRGSDDTAAAAAAATVAMERKLSVLQPSDDYTLNFPHNKCTESYALQPVARAIREGNYATFTANFQPKDDEERQRMYNLLGGMTRMTWGGRAWTDAAFEVEVEKGVFAIAARVTADGKVRITFVDSNKSTAAAAASSTTTTTTTTTTVGANSRMESLACKGEELIKKLLSKPTCHYEGFPSKLSVEHGPGEEVLLAAGLPTYPFETVVIDMVYRDTSELDALDVDRANEVCQMYWATRLPSAVTTATTTTTTSASAAAAASDGEEIAYWEGSAVPLYVKKISPKRVILGMKGRTTFDLRLGFNLFNERRFLRCFQKPMIEKGQTEEVVKKLEAEWNLPRYAKVSPPIVIKSDADWKRAAQFIVDGKAAKICIEYNNADEKNSSKRISSSSSSSPATQVNCTYRKSLGVVDMLNIRGTEQLPIVPAAYAVDYDDRSPGVITYTFYPVTSVPGPGFLWETPANYCEIIGAKLTTFIRKIEAEQQQGGTQ